MRCLLLLLPALLLTAQTPATHKKAAEHKAPSVANYKETGLASAPMVIEEYADYQCPHCRHAFEQILPELTADFVKTGKARILHRDFPLPMHPYARQAAMLADAAGEVGYYETAATQIFKTQDEWGQNGNVDAQLAKVLPPGAMQQVRELVKSDPKLDAGITEDVNMGQNVDHINETPTFVLVKNGNRQPVSSALPYPVIKKYIESVLAGK